METGIRDQVDIIRKNIAAAALRSGRRVEGVRLMAVTKTVADHRIREAVEAGVDIIGVGDAAASLIGPELYNELVWPYEKRLVDGLHAMGAKVRLHICGNTSKIVEGIGRLGCEMVDLDYFVSVADARRAMGPDQVLLGNLDPVRVIRDGTPESITAAVAECHRQAGPHYIVGAGCEIPRATAPDNVLALTRYAQTHRP